MTMKMLEDNDKIVMMMKSRIWPVCSSWQRVTCDAGSSCGRQQGTRSAPSRACPWSSHWLSSGWWWWNYHHYVIMMTMWWLCDNDVPEDCTDYHQNDYHLNGGRWCWWCDNDVNVIMMSLRITLTIIWIMMMAMVMIIGMMMING